MALYADFFTPGLKRAGDGWARDYASLARALGDRGVIRVDARLRMGTVHGIAREECIRRGYLGYRLYRGRIGDPRYLTEVIRVHSPALALASATLARPETAAEEYGDVTTAEQAHPWGTQVLVYAGSEQAGFADVLASNRVAPCLTAGPWQVSLEDETSTDRAVQAILRAAALARRGVRVPGPSIDMS